MIGGKARGAHALGQHNNIRQERLRKKRGFVG